MDKGEWTGVIGNESDQIRWELSGNGKMFPIHSSRMMLRQNSNIVLPGIFPGMWILEWLTQSCRIFVFVFISFPAIFFLIASVSSRFPHFTQVLWPQPHNGIQKFQIFLRAPPYSTAVQRCALAAFPGATECASHAQGSLGQWDDLRSDYFYS